MITFPVDVPICMSIYHDLWTSLIDVKFPPDNTAPDSLNEEESPPFLTEYYDLRLEGANSHSNWFKLVANIQGAFWKFSLDEGTINGETEVCTDVP